MALIRAETLKDDLENMKSNCNHMSDQILIDAIKELVDTQPVVDVVPISVLEQVKWEHDMAMKQLEEHNIPFGGIVPDVVKVVRCKDCKWSEIADPIDTTLYKCFAFKTKRLMDENSFCSIGKKEVCKNETEKT